MANIKNMPSFYLDDDQNENFPSYRFDIFVPRGYHFCFRLQEFSFFGANCKAGVILRLPIMYCFHSF